MTLYVTYVSLKLKKKILIQGFPLPSGRQLIPPGVYPWRRAWDKSQSLMHELLLPAPHTPYFYQCEPITRSWQTSITIKPKSSRVKRILSQKKEHFHTQGPPEPRYWWGRPLLRWEMPPLIQPSAGVLELQRPSFGLIFCCNGTTYSTAHPAIT